MPSTRATDNMAWVSWMTWVALRFWSWIACMNGSLCGGGSAGEGAPFGGDQVALDVGDGHVAVALGQHGAARGLGHREQLHELDHVALLRGHEVGCGLVQRVGVQRCFLVARQLDGEQRERFEIGSTRLN